MVSALARLALGLSLVSHSFAQDQFVSEIPAEEEAALAAIVEDEAPPPPPLRKGGSNWESPVYPDIFKKPLPIPAVKQPKQKITNPVTGNEIWYYEMEIKPFTQQIYPPPKQPARFVGYDGIAPGPTIIVPIGTESVVRFINNADRENSVHLHGSPSRAPFDGWAEDVTLPGQYKDYYYPNNQAARFLWYHDHAEGITSENALFGQAGAYLINDPAEAALGLPSGYGQYDIPLVLSSRFYNQDGTLQSAIGEEESYWGDVIHVNGQPWPFFNVEPRKYRLRFLDASLSRSFALSFNSAAGAQIPFKVIASDAGLLDQPQQVSQLFISMAERYEVVIDFAQFAGQTITLKNAEKVGDFGTDEDYAATDRVMQFVVSKTPVADPSNVPATLRTVPFPPQTSGIDHHFRFHRTNSEWRINGIGFADVENRVLAKVPRGTVEIWELENGSGGWTHPIHVHLVDFRVIQRTGGDRGVEPYEAHGLKDVVWLAKGETVLVEAHYAPWNGVYMFHCHNLIHEDHDMMAAFNVTKLENFGYNETTDFGDPMDPRWRAVPYNKADFSARSGPFTDQSITQKVQDLARQQPYSELEQVEDALEAANPLPKKRGLKEREPETTGPIPRYHRRFVL